jgi:hypothetical protein
MFNPIKLILNNLISWGVMIVIIGGGYLTYLNIQSQKYSPDGISKIFLELISNPTEIVSSEENKKINGILDTTTLSARKFEEAIVSFRTINSSYPLVVQNISKSTPYSNIVYSLQGLPTDATVTLFLEQYGEWYTGIKHHIFHIEFKGLEALVKSDLKTDLIDSLLNVKEVISDNITKVTNQYGDDVLKKILPKTTTTPDIKP